MSDILKRPAFRHFILSRFLITWGIQIQLVAVSWQLYSLTKDALALGMIGLAEAIPAIGFALLAGDLIDKGDAKRWAIRADLLIFAQAAVLVLLSWQGHQLPKPVLLFLIYMCIFFWGAGRAFLRSSYFTLFAEILPRKDFIKAEAWNSSAWQLASSSGPALGGIFYGFFGPTVTYLISAISFGIATLAMVTLKDRDIKPKSEKEPWNISLFKGLKFVFSNKIILSAISLDLFAVLFGGAIALLPIFADRLGIGPEGLGWLRAAPCIGALPVVLFLAQKPITKNASIILLTCVATFGLCWILFALSTSFIISMLLLVVSGGVDAVSVVLRGAILQLNTPDNMRGRVSGVNGVFISSSNEIGAVESGIAAKVMGLVPSVIFGGVMTILIVFGVAWASKPLRKLNLSTSE